MSSFKNLPKVVKAFVITFLSLAIVASVLNFVLGVSLESGLAKALIAVLLIGIPAYVHFKDK